jgi:chromosome segregation ATPase
MLTMRPFEPSGEWGNRQKKEYILDKRGEKIYDPKKRQYQCRSVPSTNWNEQTKAEEWRAAWAEAVNVVLEQQEIEGQIDHRSYERQGIEQVPTVHMGVAATQMERKGIATEQGNTNREIAVTNKLIRQLRARINHLVDWLKEADAPTVPPTLMSIIQSIAKGGGQSDRYVRIPEKTAARVLAFLRENDISTLPALRRKVYEMQNQLDDLRGSMKYIERRLTTLDEHIRQGDVSLKHRELYAEYQRLGPRKQPKFYEARRAELMMFEAAKRYLDAHLNGHELPLEAWKEEREKLAAERGEFSREYAALKEQALDVESVQWTAERILREAKQPQKDQREKAR